MEKLVMHCYTVDSGESDKRIIYQALLSILGIYLINQILGYFKIDFPWWLESPSILSLYKALSTLFNKKLWKYSFWKFLGIPNRPDFNGIWEGNLKSSFDDFSAVTKFTLTIKQTYDEIQISGHTPNSSSFSTSAVLFLSKPSKPSLCYTFKNTPNPDAINTMANHDGTAFLSISENKIELNGTYYTGRGRQNYGKIALTKRLV
jgi:hypothetical protein